MKSKQFAKLMHDVSWFLLTVLSTAFVLELFQHFFMLA
jgi:hypothetical protein